MRGSVVAVGSRSEEAARTFASNYQVAHPYSTYDSLVMDPAVDAVYISLPNSLHHEWTIRSLRAGKHVLCEKPFALDMNQAREMFDEARRAKRVLVEAFMYHSHPLMDALKREVESGAIGRLLMIRTSFCYKTNKIDGNVRFDRSLGGGGLMDVGCYCVNFSRTFANAEPDRVDVVGHLHRSGVDDLVVGTMRFPNGVVASFTCGTQVQADNTAYLCGSDGYIEIPVPWKPPRLQAAYTVARSTPPRMDQPGASAPAAPPRVTHHVDAPSELYGCEADDFAATVLDGTPPRVTELDTIGNMKVLDEMRRHIGLNFQG
jgi:predicted dehydrogenase